VTFLVVEDFPVLFAEFRGKCFSLLWRGNRESFPAGNCHGRCDAHAPTLALVQDVGWKSVGDLSLPRVVV
jgi:hypothetical protein